MTRGTMIVAAVSLGFFFVTATTFTSLGYLLYTMVAELGWSQAAAGASFALLGLACGLSSPLPPLLMKAIGTRLTLVTGAAVLAAGFFLAASVHGIGLFFVATAIMGAGFSLIAPSPGVFLIATWMPDRTSRVLGFYFMAGAVGGVAGPLMVGTIVGLTGSWRLHWATMGVLSALLALVFLLVVRDAVRVESAEQVKQAGHAGEAVARPSPWTVRAAMRTGTFAAIVVPMIVVQTVVTTMHSTLVAHVAALGLGSAAGAWAMSLLALSGTIAKGVTGAAAERHDPRRLLAAGLAFQAGGIALLCVAGGIPATMIAALLFGTGWGLAWLAAHILLLRYFGGAIAGDLTAMATMATTVAVLGPLSAGWVADRTGSFVPVFAVFVALLALVTLTTLLLLRSPAGAPASTDEVAAPDTESDEAFALVAAE